MLVTQTQANGKGRNGRVMSKIKVVWATSNKNVEDLLVGYGLKLSGFLFLSLHKLISQNWKITHHNAKIGSLQSQGSHHFHFTSSPILLFPTGTPTLSHFFFGASSSTSSSSSFIHVDSFPFSFPFPFPFNGFFHSVTPFFYFRHHQS